MTAFNGDTRAGGWPPLGL